MPADRDAPDVLFLDRQVLVLRKPAGMPAQPDATGDPSAASWCADFLRREQNRPDWNPFVAPVHRLDRPVSGLLVLARTSKSADRLTAQFRTRTVHKCYLAVVSGSPRFDRADIRLFLKKDSRDNLVEYSPSPFAGAREALSSLQVIFRGPDETLVAMLPHTGRSHQLRATAAFLGHPILGDLKYGADGGLGHWIALHACALRFEHPVEHTRLTVRAALPDAWCERFPWFVPWIPGGMLPPRPCAARTRALPLESVPSR